MQNTTKKTVIAAALAAILGAPALAHAADDAALAQIRAELKQMKEAYEARIRALEDRLQAAESRGAQAAAPATAAAAQAGAPVLPAMPPAPSASSAAARAGAQANAFNPAVSLVLNGTYANLKKDPETYAIQGFLPGGEEIGPGRRGFALGESELTLSANVDPRFSGKLTFALTPDNEAEVEEALFETRGLANGLKLAGGRFLSSIGYLNNQHAHAWDFTDAPLAYQAFLGGRLGTDGLQLKWLAPTDRFLEFGAEIGSGDSFPGTGRNKNGIGATALYAHVGDDLGDSLSWRAGLSWLRTRAAGREWEDVDSLGADVANAFDGRSRTWIVDGVLKWAPGGDARRTSFKLQGEYFRRKEDGSVTYDLHGASQGMATGAYAHTQSGWYLQGVYQFMPAWRMGVRYDKLDAGTPRFAFDAPLGAADFGRLAGHSPKRTSVMFDWSPTEFSRLRLQVAQDKARAAGDGSDRQVFLQYIMSLGAHGAHAF